MSALVPLIVLAVMVVAAMLSQWLGADSRPGVDRPAELWFGQRP